jgi:mRNA capping enzyme, catalytic domain/mRNA capping enzyme, C-terminal domain
MKRTYDQMTSSSIPSQPGSLGTSSSQRLHRSPFKLQPCPQYVNDLRQILLKLIFAGGQHYDVNKYISEHCELPGPLAVTLSRRSLLFVQQNDYFVCEKSDGERMMMLSLPFPSERGTPKGTYLLNRSFDAFTFDKQEEYVPILTSGASIFNGQQLTGPTLLDGELLVRSTDENTGTFALAVYMVFDLVTLYGQNVGNKPFDVRMQAIGNNIRLPFRTVDDVFLKHVQQGGNASSPTPTHGLPLYLLGKEFLPKSQITKVFQHIHQDPNYLKVHHEQSLPFVTASSGIASFESGSELSFDHHRKYIHGTRVNGTDGIIFTPRSSTYVDLFSSGLPSCTTPLLKWKYIDEQTIDFRLRLDDLVARENQYNTVSIPWPISPSTSSIQDSTPLTAPTSPLQLRAVALWISTGRDKKSNTDTEVKLAKVLMDDSGCALYASQMEDAGVDSWIVECAYDERVSAWVIRRIRDHKTRANHLNTAWSTMEVLADGIDQQDLVTILSK